MPRIYDSTDFFWTSRGDIKISNGDIMDTAFDPLRSHVQEIRTRVSSDLGSWKGFPDLGSSVADFVGEQNTKRTAEMIKTRLIAALARHNFMSTNDLDIKYMPYAHDKILFRIKIRVMATVENGNSEELFVHYLYNYEEDQVSFLF
jgi:hypothetical protein